MGGSLYLELLLRAQAKLPSSLSTGLIS